MWAQWCMNVCALVHCVSMCVLGNMYVCAYCGCMLIMYTHNTPWQEAHLTYTHSKRIHNFMSSEMPHNESILWDLIVNTFTVVEVNFEFWSFEMLQNEGFSWEIIVNIFTMVEENFDFMSSEMPQNESILWDLIVNTFTMVEEMLNFGALKCSRMKVFHEKS